MNDEAAAPEVAEGNGEVSEAGAFDDGLPAGPEVEEGVSVGVSGWPAGYESPVPAPPGEPGH